MRALILSMLLLLCAGCAQLPPDGPAVLSAGPDATGARVVLHGGPGPCVGEAKLAVWTRPGAPPVLGCWIVAGVGVWVSFLDGERADIPAGRLVRVESL
jgi:hypothetical protein